MLEFSWAAFGFTVVNFLLLVGLLYRFLHKPILNALETRKRKIEEARNRAEEKAREADAAREKYEREMSAINEEREKALSEARREAEKARESLLAKARKEAETQVENLKRDWERQRRDAVESLQQEMAETALALTKHLLIKLAAADLEAKFREWRQAELERYLSEHPIEDTAPIRVVSAQDLSEDDRKQILEKIHAAEEKKEVRFETDASLVAGSRIEFSSAAIDASLAGVLQDLRDATPDESSADKEEGEEK